MLSTTTNSVVVRCVFSQADQFSFPERPRRRKWHRRCSCCGNSLSVTARTCAIADGVVWSAPVKCRRGLSSQSVVHLANLCCMHYIGEQYESYDTCQRNRYSVF